MDGLLKYLKKNPDSENAVSEENYVKTLKVFLSTDVGYVRDHNEDNFFIDELGVRSEENQIKSGELVLDRRRIFAVCDGMGGEDFGDEASAISVEILGRYSGKISEASKEELHDSVNSFSIAANNEICEMVRQRRAHQSGCTLAMVTVDRENINIFNIGDSRVYIYYENVLTQMTEDQTLAMKKLKANIYTEEEAMNSPDSHTITSFLGVDSRGIGPKTVRSGPYQYEPMTLLICSDGLTDMCSDEEIEEILGEDYENPADELVKKALEYGGYDNTTCIVIQV